jgi:diguanylate cyclase
MYGLATKVARQNKLLVRLSNTDELTGLANRRQGFDAAAKALARHRRNSTATVLVVLDFDRFKDVNDTYGHPFGDDVLKAVAATLRKCSRETDTIARYGGDEFILVLADTDLQGAHVVAKRIREQLAVIKFAEAPGLRCTVSLGLAEAYDDTTEVEDWIHQADGALYRAKAAGRDCVVSAPKVHRSGATSATHP